MDAAFAFAEQNRSRDRPKVQDKKHFTMFSSGRLTSNIRPYVTARVTDNIIEISSTVTLTAPSCQHDLFVARFPF